MLPSREMKCELPGSGRRPKKGLLMREMGPSRWGKVDRPKMGGWVEGACKARADCRGPGESPAAGSSEQERFCRVGAG